MSTTANVTASARAKAYRVGSEEELIGQALTCFMDSANGSLVQGAWMIAGTGTTVVAIAHPLGTEEIAHTMSTLHQSRNSHEFARLMISLIHDGQPFATREVVGDNLYNDMRWERVSFCGM